MKTLEEWKSIPGYEGLYEISNQGRVKSLERIDANGVKRGGIRKNSISARGYSVIQLFKDGKAKYFFVHRLVAAAFIPNPRGHEFINHKDENKTNNSADNLEWCNAEYNNNYGTRIEKVAKKMGVPVVAIDKKTGVREKFFSINEAARKTGASARHIYRVLHNQRKTTKGRYWKYEDA